MSPQGDALYAARPFDGTARNGDRAVVSVDRLFGLLSQTMGNMDRAAQHFEEALAFTRKASYRPDLV